MLAQAPLLIPTPQTEGWRIPPDIFETGTRLVRAEVMNGSKVLPTLMLLNPCNPKEFQAECLSYLVVFPRCLFLLLFLMHRGLQELGCPPGFSQLMLFLALSSLQFLHLQLGAEKRVLKVQQCRLLLLRRGWGL